MYPILTLRKQDCYWNEEGSSQHILLFPTVKNNLKKKEEKKKEIKKVPFLCNMSESDSVLSSYCSPLFKAKARRRDHQEGSVAKIDSISSESPVKN